MSQPEVTYDKVVDLGVLGKELFDSTGDEESGRAGRTVFHGAGLRATVIALRAGHELAEHAAPPAATLYVHSGDVRLRTEGRDQALSAGQLAAIPPERHSLFADTDAVVVLTVRFD